MTLIVGNPTAPLDPDPFLLDGSQRLDLGQRLVVHLHPRDFFGPSRLGTPGDGLYRPVESSLAAVAHIPPGVLAFPYSAFRDDGVSEQDDWLSRVYVANRFRLMNGLRVVGFADPTYGFDNSRPDGRLLGRSNPTTFRFLPFMKFRAPVEHVNYLAPGRLPLPPVPSNQEVLAVGSDMRAVNGFLANSMGAMTWRLQRAAARAFGLPARAEIPQIGVSLQVWLAQDGCKCFAFAHNYFPRYTLYLDGVRLDWDSALNFQKFDDYDVNDEWQPFLAFMIHDALFPFPLRDRYPGACGVGWYRSVLPDGQIEWCEDQPPAEIISFAPPKAPADDFIRAWWGRLEEYVRLFVTYYREHRHGEHQERYPWWREYGRLKKIWASLEIRARRVGVHQNRRREAID